MAAAMLASSVHLQGVPSVCRHLVATQWRRSVPVHWSPGLFAAAALRSTTEPPLAGVGAFVLVGSARALPAGALDLTSLPTAALLDLAAVPSLKHLRHALANAVPELSRVRQNVRASKRKATVISSKSTVNALMGGAALVHMPFAVALLDDKAGLMCIAPGDDWALLRSRVAHMVVAPQAALLTASAAK